MEDHTKVSVVDVREGRASPPRRAEKFSSEEFADAAISFLREQRGNGPPFFCYVAFTAPHDPRNPPTAYREMYYRRPPPVPRNFLPEHPFDNGFARNIRDENLAAYPRTKQTIQEQLCEYYGLITHLDEQVGRVLAALEESGQARNTLVVYTADHGLALGSHGLLGKQSVYEHSMKSPLIVAGPGVPRHKATDAFTSLLDLSICFPPSARRRAQPRQTGSPATIWRLSGPGSAKAFVIPSSSPTPARCVRCATSGGN
jgi:arylsulfatase A-like enzyme